MLGKIIKRLLLSVFLLVFLLAGIGLTVFLGRDIWAKGDWLSAFFLAGPLLFTLIGAGGLYFTWFALPWDDGPSPSISERATGQGGGILILVYAFCLTFMLVGIGLFLKGAAVPFFRYAQAHSWIVTPCVIVSSQVTRDDSGDGTSYGVAISYTYERSGQRKTSQNYLPYRFSSSNSGKARRIVKHYRPGSETACFVNPLNSDEAVLTRGDFPWELLLIAGLALAFVGMGGGGLAYFASKVRKARTPPRTGQLPATSEPAAIGSVTLKPKSPPVRTFLVTLFFAVFWNGFLVLVAWLVLVTEGGSEIGWFAIIFFALFALIGLLIVGAAVGTFMRLFNPRPTVTLDKPGVCLGDSLHVRLSFTGRSDAIKNLTVYVEGREEATHSSGSSSSTDTNPFARIPIPDLHLARSGKTRTAALTLPPNAMYSFKAGNNKVTWWIVIKGDISAWRNLDQEFEIQVLPRKTGTYAHDRNSR